MVAIAKILIVLIISISAATAQSVEQKSLLTALERLEGRREEINTTITQLRRDYTSVASGSERESIASRIANLEGDMLDVTQQINETQLKLAQYELTQESTKRSQVRDEAKSIAESTYARKRLSHNDLKSLYINNIGAIDSLCASQEERLLTLGSLRNQYNQCEGEREALAIVDRFDSLKMVTESYSRELARQWGEVYDNKLFALNVLIEHIDNNQLRTDSQNISRSSGAALGDLGSDIADPAVANYEYQRRELLAIELLIARSLALTNAVDSLSAVNKELSAKWDDNHFAPIEIEERIFIDYAPITFSSKQIYSKSNPIPATKIFKRGVVYRILYGGFTSPQQPTLFRGAKPLSVNKEENLNRYYGGGYKSYREAVEAQKASKAKGFNRPEIVMWRDGVSRNLSRQPYPKGGYKVVIKGCEELPDRVAQLTSQYDKDAQITRTGNGEYIISTFTDRMVAEDLMGEITDIDKDYIISIE